MDRAKSRFGFTLVELMLVVTVLSIVMAAVASSFIGGVRLLKVTVATTEMSLQARELRERLLFHAAPAHDDTVWAGLLSGTNATDVLEGNSTKILMYCPALQNVNGTTANQTIQLIFKNYGTKKCSFFSEDRYDERWRHRWLNPGGLNLLADSADTPPLVWARKADNSEDHTRFYIRLTGRAEVARFPIEHDERIVVPVFGQQQETRLDGKGGLDK
jgi:prepilin-type N-terminal cleavage/methylation domain-containing protein